MEKELKSLRRSNTVLLVIAIGWWIIAVIVAHNGLKVSRALDELRTTCAQ
jgi:uncharacterized protein YoxC